MPHPTDEELGFSKPPNPERKQPLLSERLAGLSQEEREVLAMSEIIKGYRYQESIAEAILRLWKITPNFRRKDWKELILFLKEAGDPVGKLESFAKYWENDDWRGKQGQPPTADQIHELLPRALDRYGESAKRRTWADVAEECEDEEGE